MARTDSGNEPIEITPACCCGFYLFLASLCFLILAGFHLLVNNIDDYCYLDLFADSVSVTNISTNATTADWNIGLVAKSSVSQCSFSLHTIQSRLLYEDKIISQFSALMDDPGLLFASNRTVVDFNSVVMKQGVAAGGVVWDFGVRTIARVTNIDRVKTKYGSGGGFVEVNCGDLPVNFTADPKGNMAKGSLIGNMIRCDYRYRENLDFSS